FSWAASGSVLVRRVFREVLVAVRVVERGGRIGNRQALRTRLSVDVIVGAGHDVEVAGFVDQRAGLRIGAGQRGGPERTADEDFVRPGRIHVRVVVLVAAAVDLDLAAALVQRSVDRGEVRLGGAVARARVRTEPRRVARAHGAGIEIALGVLGIVARLHHGAARARDLRAA